MTWARHHPRNHGKYTDFELEFVYSLAKTKLREAQNTRARDQVCSRFITCSKWNRAKERWNFDSEIHGYFGIITFALQKHTTVNLLN